MTILRRGLAALVITLVLFVSGATVTYYLALWDASSFMVNCNNDPVPDGCD